jgi:hypothetical protein
MERKDKEVTLNQLLDKKQIKGLEKVINDLSHKKIDCINPEYSKRLKSFLGNMKEDLNKKGIDSDYLAYVIIDLECKKRNY